nr:unnamed protein product [Callosobruchus analis]
MHRKGNSKSQDKYPSRLVHACKIVRTHPKPYDVKCLTHEFFKKFDDLNYYKSVRPGTATVTKFEPLSTTAQEKYISSLETLTFGNCLTKESNCPNHNLYVERRKIRKDKYEHLQILKFSDYYDFYDNLPHE